jgi:hypothetical protein
VYIRHRIRDHLLSRLYVTEYFPVPTSLSLEEGREFVFVVLADEGTREDSKVGGLTGRHISRQGAVKHLRGSDFTERVYACVEALRKTGMSTRQACRYIVVDPHVRARIKLHRRSRRKRGRRWTRRDRKRDIFDDVETIRNLYYSFKPRRPWTDWAFQFWWIHYQWIKGSRPVGRNRTIQS